MAKPELAASRKELAQPNGFQIVDADQLIAHPGNANVMSAELLEKLKGHIARSGRYPALIVRSLGNSQRFPDEQAKLQVLDGHHRLNEFQLPG